MFVKVPPKEPSLVLDRFWAQTEFPVGSCLLFRVLPSPGVPGSPGAGFRRDSPYRARKHQQRRRCAFFSASPHSHCPDSPQTQLLPHPLPIPQPAPACASTPMPARTPELGWVPVRQADTTGRHSQTWKLLGTMGCAKPPAPLGPAGVGSIPAGSRQPAGTKFPRNLMNAMHPGLPRLLSSRGTWCQPPLPAPAPSVRLPARHGQHSSPATRPVLRDACSIHAATRSPGYSGDMG